MHLRYERRDTEEKNIITKPQEAVIFGSFAVDAIFRWVNDGRPLDTLQIFALAAAREIGMCGH